MVAGEVFLPDALHKLESVVRRLPVPSRGHDENHWGSLQLQIVLEEVT